MGGGVLLAGSGWKKEGEEEVQRRSVSEHPADVHVIQFHVFGKKDNF